MTSDEAAKTPSALEGLVVLEAATLGAAPWIGTFLAELGAEVIKVEPPGKGDPVRGWGAQKNGAGLMWKSIGRNKKTVTLDLHKARGQELFRELITQVDVLIVNFRPGTLERWGLGWADLKVLNSALIMVHVTAFGLTGTYSDRPGFGTLIEAMSGFAHVTGDADGPPTLPSFPLADAIAAQAGASGCLAALYHRDVLGGGGQLVDVSLLEPLTRMLEQSVLEYDQLGIIQRRAGNRWPISAPRNTYRTSDGEWIAMSGSSPSAADRAIRAIGREEWLADATFASAQGRLERAEEVDRAFEVWIGERTLEDAMEVFERFEVAAAPVYSVDRLLDDPHVKSRGIFQSVRDAELGSMIIQGPPVRLEKTPGAVAHLGRPLGADTRTVLEAYCGVDERTLDELRAEGVV